MLSINIQIASDDSIALAAKILRGGGLVAFPTETVYGLGANALSDSAVAEIFAIKGRPEFNPLIVHVCDTVMAQRIVEWNQRAEKLAHAFWPGPLTLVLTRLKHSPVSLLASAGGDTIGVRMPAHDAARAIIKAADVPIAAPSANRSGRVSPTNVQHVYEEFKDALPLIIDAGACTGGIESTVIDICGDTPVLLRPGLITKVEIEKVLGENVSSVLEYKDGFKSPGLLSSHYAPTLPVRLDVMKPLQGEALLAFGSNIPPAAKVINLSRAGDLKEAAAHLFAAMRALDKKEYSAIAVMPIPEEGIGVAINDRLRRAATR